MEEEEKAQAHHGALCFPSKVVFEADPLPQSIPAKNGAAYGRPCRPPGLLRAASPPLRRAFPLWLAPLAKRCLQDSAR